MKKELSDKQQEAKRLYSQIIQIDLTEVPVVCVTKYGHPYTHNCVMCKINGTKYINLSSLNECAGFISILEKRGGITERDLLHCRRGGNYQYRGVVNKMIRISTVLRYKDEALQYVIEKKPDSDTELRRIFKKLEDDAFELPEITIDKAALSQSETLYLQRNTLLREDAEERRKEKGREALEKLKNELQHREQSQENETLKGLVSKIEAMGWEVTLSLKPV